MGCYGQHAFKVSLRMRCRRQMNIFAARHLDMQQAEEHRCLMQEAVQSTSRISSKLNLIAAISTNGEGLLSSQSIMSTSIAFKVFLLRLRQRIAHVLISGAIGSSFRGACRKSAILLSAISGSVSIRVMRRGPSKAPWTKNVFGIKKNSQTELHRHAA